MRATYHSELNRSSHSLLASFVLFVVMASFFVLTAGRLVQNVIEAIDVLNTVGQPGEMKTLSIRPWWIISPFATGGVAYLSAYYLWKQWIWRPTRMLEIVASDEGITFNPRGREDHVLWDEIEQLHYIRLGFYKRETRWQNTTLENLAWGDLPNSTQAYYQMTLKKRPAALILSTASADGSQFIHEVLQQLAVQRIPALRAAYKNGKPLGFGELTIDMNGWTHKQKHLDWTDFGGVEIRFGGRLQEYFFIYYWGRNRRGRRRRRTWYKAPVSRIPNLFLLHYLVATEVQKGSVSKKSRRKKARKGQSH